MWYYAAQKNPHFIIQDVCHSRIKNLYIDLLPSIIIKGEEIMTKIKRISPKFEAQIDKIHRYIDIDDCNR